MTCKTYYTYQVYNTSPTNLADYTRTTGVVDPLYCRLPATHSVREIAWHRREQPLEAVCGEEPVVAIVPSFWAGIYRRHRGTTILLFYKKGWGAGGVSYVKEVLAPPPVAAT